MTPDQAAEKYHWIKYDKATNTIDMYMDHYMLSGARLCESKFYLEHLLWVKPKYNPLLRKPWFLDFGEFVHYSLELFYHHFKLHKTPPVVNDWLTECKKMWDKMDMDGYKDYIIEADRKKYAEIKGWEGAAGLLIEYYAYYMDLKVRVVDTEITFGHNKEVLIGKWSSLYNVELQERIKRLGKKKLIQVPCYINCYLTGRIDLLVDNGYKIGPVDHKTTHKFDGYEHLDFNPQDGILGYILAINCLLTRYKEQGLTNLNISNDGWIYHISSSRPSVPRDTSKKPGPRFKVTPIGKTPSQLEDFKARQLSTFKRVAELLFNDKVPEWNTYTCNNIFFRPCEYKSIHEQPSEEWSATIKQFYQITTSAPWDTRTHAPKDNTINKIIEKEDATTLQRSSAEGVSEPTDTKKD